MTHLYYVEDQDKGWTWVEADCAQAAAATVAGPDHVAAYNGMSHRLGFPAEQFEIRDTAGAVVDRYMVTPERMLPGIGDPEPEQQGLEMEVQP